MSRKSPLRFLAAAVLAFGLLPPSAAAARGPVHETASRAGWGILPGSLWDLLLQALGPASRKNGSQIGPNCATAPPAPAPQSDNRGTIDPNGLKNRSQIDPNGATVAPDPGASQSDNHGTIDPNG
jgi:hypothetical protein